MFFPCSHVSDFRASEALDDAPSDAPNGAPVERAPSGAKHPAQNVRPVQESCRALFTSLMIAAAVGSVRPPASVVGTPRASASTR
jgi:hypothetical protein